MQITISPHLAHKLATLAWSSGFQAAQAKAPITATFFEEGWLWWNGLRPQLRGLPDTEEGASAAIWNFFQGARYSMLGDAIARHPEPPTGAWCTLFWPTLDALPLASAVETHTRGWMDGARCLALAVHCEQQVLLDERSIRDLGRVEFRLFQPSSPFLTFDQASSAFTDGFFAGYWSQAGAWLARALGEVFQPLQEAQPSLSPAL